MPGTRADQLLQDPMNLHRCPRVALAVGEELGSDLPFQPLGGLLLKELVVLGHGVVPRGDLQVGVARSRAEGGVGRLDAEGDVKVGMVDPTSRITLERSQSRESMS